MTNMEFQSNPYLIWQLVPGLITLGIGLYIQSRPMKKRESNVFSLLMFGGSVWAFANAIQLITADIGWQKIWNTLTYLGIMLIPTAWFLLSVKLTGIGRETIEKVERWLWFIPGILYLSMLSNRSHHLFFRSTEIINVGGYASLENEYGPLFFFHTGYSYLLMFAGILILGVSLAMNFKSYGSQVYGLIVGVLAPLIGNAFYLFGSPPPVFQTRPLLFSQLPALLLPGRSLADVSWKSCPWPMMSSCKSSRPAL
jgi:hypothetical protein